MLQLINQARAYAGVRPVRLGTNRAAQLHAEAMRDGCFYAHWGLNGLTSVMRYTLAGGHQASTENVSGLDTCIGRDRARPIHEGINVAMRGYMASPSHRGNILDPAHKLVNIGIAGDAYSALSTVQQFEGDYITYAALPAIENGLVALSGRVYNGARLKAVLDLGVQFFYDPPPKPLTLGQLARTFCGNSSLLLAELRPPPPEGREYEHADFQALQNLCPSPYDIPADVPLPQSAAESIALWRAAQDAVRSETVTAQFITSSKWDVGDDRFDLEADVSDVLQDHGPGVYTVQVWARLDGEMEIISRYAIFHEVDVPEGYGAEKDSSAA